VYLTTPPTLTNWFC